MIISRAITILAMLFYVACSSSLATGFVRLLEPGINYSKTVLETSEEMNAWPQQWSLFPISLAIFSPLVITRFFASLDKFSVISVALLNLGNMGERTLATESTGSIAVTYYAGAYFSDLFSGAFRLSGRKDGCTIRHENC